MREMDTMARENKTFLSSFHSNSLVANSGVALMNNLGKASVSPLTARILTPS